MRAAGSDEIGEDLMLAIHEVKDTDLDPPGSCVRLHAPSLTLMVRAQVPDLEYLADDKPLC